MTDWDGFWIDEVAKDLVKTAVIGGVTLVAASALGLISARPLTLLATVAVVCVLAFLVFLLVDGHDVRFFVIVRGIALLVVSVALLLLARGQVGWPLALGVTCVATLVSYSPVILYITPLVVTAIAGAAAAAYWYIRVR